ncbi:MAG: protease pro-enzyme activation domain-containing protein [Terracidiphilus sp.]|jgi:subtilase family serine protease
MIKLRSLPLRIPLCVALCILSSAILFPALSQGQGVAPTVRIHDRIDDSQLVTLKGNTHPFANARHDMGKVANSLPMTDLILVLSRDPAQQAAFDAYVAGEYDQNSPNFHQWLTPDQIGEQFGPSLTDIQTITNWLTGHGFTISPMTRDHMTIRFSGTAEQVESTFHTEIHNLVVKGQAHIGNMSDPQIPSALSSVVVGVKSLHNFFPTPAHHMGQTVQRDASSGKWARPAMSTTTNPPRSTTGPSTTFNPGPNVSTPRPQFGITASCGNNCNYLVEDVGPWDFATIYDVTPLWSASTPIDGKGQTIAIAGTSAIDIGETAGSGLPGSGTAVQANGLNDVTTFRDFFSLPTNNSWNQPIQVSGNPSPLTVCNGVPALCTIDDLLENSLDVEWSGSIAKNAQIVLVASYPTSTADDNLYDSESYIVDHVGDPTSPVYGVHVMNVSYGECELGLGTAGNVQYYDLWEEAYAEGLAVFVATGDSGSTSCDDGGDQSYGTPYAALYGINVSGLASTPYNTAVGGTDFNWCSLNTDIFSECSAGTYWSATEQTPPGGTTPSFTALGYLPEVPWNDTCSNAPLALTGLQAYASYLAANYSADGYSTSYLGSGNQKYSIIDGETACNWLAYTDYFEGLPTAFENMVDTVGGSGGASSCVVNSTNPTGTTFGACTTGATTTGSTTNPDNNASQVPVAVALDTAANNTGGPGWPKPYWQVSAESIGVPNDNVRDIPDVSFFASDGFLSSSAYLICVSADASAYFNSQPCSYSGNKEPFAEEVGGTSVATPAMAGVMALINQKAGAAQGSPNQELYTLASKQTYSSCSSERGGGSPVTSSTCLFNDIDQGTNAMACGFDYYTGEPPASPNCSIAHTGDYIGLTNGYSASVGYDEATGLGSLNVANVVNAWTAVTPGPASPTVTVTPNPTSINTDNLLDVTITVAGATGAPQDPNGRTIPPTGTVKLTSGSLNLGTGTLNSGGSVILTIPANTLTGSAAGQLDTLTASYAGDVNYAAQTGTGQVTVSNISLLTPTITATPTQIGSTISVAVSVSGSGPTPTGFIILSAASGSYPATTGWIGTSPCVSTSNCVFTMQASSFTGTVTLTAQYSGDIHYAEGQTTTQVVGATFKLTAGAPSSSSVTPGQSATATVSIGAVNGYTGIVSLACAQSSTTASGGDGTSCMGSNSGQVNLATCGASCSVTFTIGTTASFTEALNRRSVPGGKGTGGSEWLGAGSGAILALLAFFGIPARRRSWRSMLSVLIALVAIGALASCSGGSGGGGGGGNTPITDPGTTAGTYTYTVTASANPSVTPTVSTTFTVTVN